MIDKEQKILNFFIIAIISMLTIANFRGEHDIFTYFELKESRNILASVLDDIKEEIDHLELEIERIEESPSYAYRVLRDKYHITEEGESIIFFSN